MLIEFLHHSISPRSRESDWRIPKVDFTFLHPFVSRIRFEARFLAFLWKISGTHNLMEADKVKEEFKAEREIWKAMDNIYPR